MDSSTKSNPSKKNHLPKPKGPTAEFPDLNQLLGGDFKFSDSESEDIFHERDLLELSPFGISVATDLKNTFFFLKDKSLSHTLSVLVNPVEASLILGHLNMAPEVNSAQPHAFVEKILSVTGIQVLRCVFVQIKGHRQWVRMYLSGHRDVNSIKLPADQAMSLCMSLKIPIFATKTFINQSKLIQVQIEGLTKNLVQNQSLLLKRSTYIQ